MPSSSLPPPFPHRIPPFPSSPRAPVLLLAATPYGPCLRQSRTVLFLSYPVHPSPPSKLANVCPPRPPVCPPPPPRSHSPFSLAAVAFLSSLVRLYTPPKCPSFSPTLLCDAGGGSGTAGRSGREVAPFAASRNLARCSFAVHREERKREREREREREIAPERRREREGRGKGERDREKPRG